METMVREAKPNTPLEPMRKAKHPGMVELRSRLEETAGSGPIKKKDDNMLHGAIDHIPKLSQVFKRFDLSNMGFVANEDLKGVFVEMKVTNKEMIEGIQYFKMHGNMVNEADFLAWAVKQDIKSQEFDKTNDDMTSPMSPTIPDISRVVSIDPMNAEGTEGLPEPGLATPHDKNVTPKRTTSILNKRGPRGTTPRSPRDKNNARLDRTGKAQAWLTHKF